MEFDGFDDLAAPPGGDARAWAVRCLVCGYAGYAHEAGSSECNAAAIALVRELREEIAAEREACARIAETWWPVINGASAGISKAIRSRASAARPPSADKNPAGGA